MASPEIVSKNLLFTSLARALDEAGQHLKGGSYFEAFEILGPQLSGLYDHAVEEDVLLEAREIVRRHEVFELCQLDPYTQRAFQKPRGYAGDAVMLDFVYSGSTTPEIAPIGEGVFQRTTRGPMGLSVLFRRSLLSAYINDVVAQNPQARILSVASGHCRGIEGTFALHNDFKGEIIAFDQDNESCAEVSRSYPRGVRTIEGNIKSLFGRSSDALGKFDFIYSAGLFDYLPESIALRLTTALKRMLTTNGRLLIGNFFLGSQGRGYLDFIMDWQLFYRTEGDLVETLGDTDGYRVSSFLDPHRNVAYAELAAP